MVDSIILSNREVMEMIVENENMKKYIFKGINDEFLIKYIRGFGFFMCDKNDNIIENRGQVPKLPNLKKLMVSFKMIDRVDNLNIFKIGTMKIVHINTTFYRYMNEKNEYIVTKESDYTEYLLNIDDIYYILMYKRDLGYYLYPITNPMDCD